MTIRNAKTFQNELNNRFLYIVHKIGEITGFDIEWFDYHNESGEHHPGFFDSQSYKNHVQYVGHFNYEKNLRFNHYDNDFPTEWFYTNFEEILIKEKEQFLQKENNKKELEIKKKLDNLEKFNQLKEQVLSKLTDEEKSIVKFSSTDLLFNQSLKNRTK